ncbi:MAG TPA: DUF2568 domain-containing protein [Glutamicibacter sp.]|jgi:hypothetical protein|uniref:DUF2568 domain-containing protein n=2 Tax=Glutamicibacter arilaitensis TaxID=256701 RepID=A0A4Y8U339_9MICC|nr:MULTISPECIES: DUF2568 domain-containing protein [Glutamicibacter]TFH57613.1 DUF2568 domain-containing protein [Glutamicibacter arilaitensis]CBT75433.1 hypothetical membrane protein [Glutamicibacter arilaitensis Re117]HCH47321.1 DUF2568 domain-containing protein [Glutamicibacter sp.]HCJ55379.1 DUF2568 domain-containing protein [Glutamicibacter sp.]
MGKNSSQRVSPFLSAIYAVVAFLLEVGLLFAAALAAIAFIDLPTIPAILVVVIPLLVVWAIFFSPKAVVKLRLRTRLLLIHIIYLVGAYVLWLSVDHSFYDQSQIWAIAMLALTAISAILVIATGGYVVPHDRTKKPPKQAPSRASSGAPKGRRAAR